MAKFITELPLENPKVNLLPYHNFAANKYIKMGSNYDKLKMEEPSEKEQNQAIDIFKQFGIEAEVGG